MSKRSITDVLDPASKHARIPKRKVALYLGYNGSGYHGMQINDTLPTIELDLFRALCRADCVSQDNSDSLKKIGFMRACRTDKGVHAAAQLVSFKMQLVENYQHDQIVEQIQAQLPSNIQVYGFSKVTAGFHAKNACSSRIYEYLIPTYAFKQWDPRFLAEEFFSQKCNSADKEQSSGSTDASCEPQSSNTQNEYATDWKQKGIEDRQSIYSYRISKQELESVSTLLHQFEGTHNFHNFTIGKLPTDPSNQRFIQSFTCGSPFLDELGQPPMEWVSLKVHGQSFMLHQIRKMIGFVILLIKSGMSNRFDLFQHAFSPAVRLNIPKVPSLGLLLERCFFDSYNTNPNCQHTERVEFDRYNDKIEQFKQDKIYPQMMEQERREMEFWNWFGCIQEHSYEYSFLSQPAPQLN